MRGDANLEPYAAGATTSSGRSSASAPRDEAYSDADNNADVGALCPIHPWTGRLEARFPSASRSMAIPRPLAARPSGVTSTEPTTQPWDPLPAARNRWHYMDPFQDRGTHPVDQRPLAPPTRAGSRPRPGATPRLAL